MMCQLTEQVDAWVFAVPGLRAVATVSSGRDHVDLAAARASGVRVINTPDVLTDATADLTMALILGVARRVAEGDTAVRTGVFGGWRLLQELLGIDVTSRRASRPTVQARWRLFDGAVRLAVSSGGAVLIDLDDSPAVQSSAQSAGEE